MITVTVKENDTPVYFQRSEDPGIMNKVISHLLTQTPGDNIVTTVEANGNSLSFRNADVDLRSLAGIVNGFVIRKTKATPPAA